MLYRVKINKKKIVSKKIQQNHPSLQRLRLINSKRVPTARSTYVKHYFYTTKYN